MEVDGFVFKRKRRTPLADSENLPAAQAKRSKPIAAREDGASPSPPGLSADRAQVDSHTLSLQQLMCLMLMGIICQVIDVACFAYAPRAFRNSKAKGTTMLFWHITYHIAFLFKQNGANSAQMPNTVQADGEAELRQEPDDACMAGQHTAIHRDAVAAAEAALNSLPRDGASEASRLLALCRKCVQAGSLLCLCRLLCRPFLHKPCALNSNTAKVKESTAMQDAVADAEGLSGAAQQQAMLEVFLTDVAASLENGTLQAAEAVPADVAAAQERQSLLKQLLSEQEVLQSRLQRFERVHSSCRPPL